MAKKRTKKKITKTAAEFSKIKKRIREQERYYSKKGFEMPSVSDAFAGTKPTRKALSELKKYEKLWKGKIADLKTAAAQIRKEKGVSASVAYQYLSAKEREKETGNILEFEDVLIDSFYKKINSFPNYQSRVKMSDFIGRMITLLGYTETARILAQTAENEEDFEAVLQYYTDDIALYNTYNLMETMVNSLSDTEFPIAKEELQLFMETLEFEV